MNLRRIAILVGTVILVASCGSNAPIAVEDAWARVSPAGVTMGAAYFKITSENDDSLIGVSVSTDIADHAEIHEVVHSMDMSDESMGMSDESMDMSDDEMHDGAMSMQQIDSLELPAGSPVRLAPGGYHIMLIDLAAPLVAGETFELTLDFATADDLTVSVEVSEG